jgi:hypothetical protein
MNVINKLRTDNDKAERVIRDLARQSDLFITFIFYLISPSSYLILSYNYLFYIYIFFVFLYNNSSIDNKISYFFCNSLNKSLDQK